MMISVSTPGRVDVAQHLGDAADRAARGVGQRVSSTVTISPGDAPPSWPGGMKISISTRRSKGTTYPMPSSSRSYAADERLVAALEDADDAALGRVRGRPC